MSKQHKPILVVKGIQVPEELYEKLINDSTC
ncbi:MAG: hypothetical protein UT24_C0003G0044 [Candidatus Woesebacteria bacterium GW2011_GWB1_39_12]|uniref:Uncharacterized protein n=1 Tax=Candidatus Woesebacteria bacterium GW2011_GWB1_39_12 TaxID=1618574 RepID=A0A0G0QIX9_9BACT|nr:MAG: hypothetical protein UT24_C0003G0044 [Candidatus Woesebacteria bacterium GW2011_GWB1_39_12]